MRHPNADLHGLRESQRRKVIAVGFYHQANCLAGVDVQGTVLYQVCIHCRVKPAVINDVVDMAIGIVVHPSGGDGPESLVGATGFGGGFGGDIWFRHRPILPARSGPALSVRRHPF